ncbi:alpha/beta fold hydrolase [Streptomyces massasporeus]|uniref:alpha/beta fold hydrolase n=1 Tax=Streptomyces massasporeus TaxID=67324 RepID=UPI003452246F
MPLTRKVRRSVSGGVRGRPGCGARGGPRSLDEVRGQVAPGLGAWRTVELALRSRRAGAGGRVRGGAGPCGRCPGTTWLVDLPGDGSNHGGPQVPARPYEQWPTVLAEAARPLDDVVMVGHSTGGMFMLSCPELEGQLAGMALVTSAPHAGWRQTFAQWAEVHPVAGLGEAADAYGHNPNDETLRLLTLAAAEWNFTPEGLAAGRALLDGFPYCHDAVAWADAHFDATYRALWKPHSGLPTLIVSGAEDHVVDQRLWADDPAFGRPHVLRRTIEGAAHFPWVENPRAVRSAFAELTASLSRAS